MKTPWTKAIERLEKKLTHTLVDFRKYIDSQVEKRYEDSKKAINLVNRSEQFKHNGHERRLTVLEDILKEEVAKIHDRNLQQEVIAAEEIEENT
jgi:hypothetical protein